LSACRPESAAGDALQPRLTADGSLSLWSERFGEAFHSGLGAHTEAIDKFVAPAQLERFPPGSRLRVLDLCVGLGYNSAALLEAAQRRQLALEWIGLELDPRPLALALADAGFRRQWQPSTLTALEQLQREGRWSSGGSEGLWHLGDARQQLAPVLQQWAGQCDLVLHDAFSPGRCPELWTVELLSGLAGLLKPQGRLLTYCAAAAVRRALELAGLELASIAAGADTPRLWSAGTAASPAPWPEPGSGSLLRPLSPMEREHLLTRAAEPYRDPSGTATAAAIQAERAQRQQRGSALSTSAWRRRWGLDRRAAEPGGAA
jgi:tRNA U34 5-methylaminomethyl-2-thiouridine-forming methyltransferase MnmC